MVYRKHPDLPREPALIVRDLRAIRQRALTWHDGVRPFGPAYRAASAIITAVDAFTTLLTGDPKYFMPDQMHGGAGSELGLHETKIARENGVEPWQRLDKPVG